MRAQGKVSYLFLFLSGFPPNFEKYMRIVNNGTDIEITEDTSLILYLQNEGLAEKTGIAVAVNETVVQRKCWADIILKPGDSILIIKATQGG